MSVEMTSGVLAARMMEGMQFTLGPDHGVPARDDPAHGGLPVTADYCADDFVLGNETFKLGQTVVLSHHAIDHMVINASFGFSHEAPGPLDEVHALLAAQGPLRHRAHLQHAVRPARTRRRRRSLSSRTGDRALCVGACDPPRALIRRRPRVVGDRSWFGLLILYPVRDLMGFFFWLASYFSSNILWRGRVFQLLPGGKMRAAK
jgi:ceramide glucosyltransferase